MGGVFRCLWLLIFSVALAREVGLQWVSDGEHIMLSWAYHEGRRMQIYRSTQPFDTSDMGDPTFPLCRLPPIFEAASFRDERLSAGTEYFYGGQTDDGWWYWANPVQLPPRTLPEELEDPWILIDKLNYCLELHCQGSLSKRYPVVFGKNPLNRKLIQDHASTPEGRYVIQGVQKKAKWYKAYDLNYPNAVDKARHKLLAPSGRPIGGEIQIHGGGIEDNWTWGCIAMRNADIDELFAHPEIGKQTIVWIVGSELTYEDLECDERAEPADPLSVGKWQRSQGLRVTCVQDAATLQRLR